MSVSALLASCAPSTSALFGQQGVRRVQVARPPQRRRAAVVVNASNRPSRRLLPFILSTPKRLDDYFERSPRRRALWCLISGGAGFYAGNIVTLSFGALAINDVLAAVVIVIFYEVVSALFYGAKRPSLRAWFANYFKLGLVAAAMADALKLGS